MVRHVSVYSLTIGIQFEFLLLKAIQELKADGNVCPQNIGIQLEFLLLQAIQELKAEVDILKQEIALLKQ